MKDKISIVIIFLTIFITISFITDVFACPCSRGSGRSTAIPTRISLPQPIIPPGFPHKWDNQNVLESIKENELEIEDITEIKESEIIFISDKSTRIMRFYIPSFGNGMTGYVFSFENMATLETSKKHFLKLNKNGELHNWSFVKDNILLVLSGTIPEDKARQYEAALYDLKKMK